MNTGDEAVSPATDPAALPRGAADPAPDPPAPAPAPVSAGAKAAAGPTPEAVLKWIAAAAGGPWFPSAHAKQAGIPRDSLDAPLNDLRQTGLVRVEAWVKGVGQGFVPTPAGAAVAAGTPVPPPAPAPSATEAPAVPVAALVADLRPPVVSPALIVANLIWFFVGLVIATRGGVPLSTYLSIDNSPAVLHRLGAVTPDDLLRGEWWRLATNCFVHVGLWHLLINVIGLGVVGPLAEMLWGRRRLFAIYALAGLGGSAFAMIHHPTVEATGASVTLAGASGAIWGVMASLVAWLVLFRPVLPRDLVADWTRRLALAFALNIGVSLIPGVSWEAHLGGGVAGFVAAGLLNAVRYGDRRRRIVATALLVLLPVAAGGGLWAAVTYSDEWALVRQQHAARRTALETAAFDRDIRPLLEPLRSDAVQPVEWAVLFAGNVRPAHRPAATAAVRARLEVVRADAAEVAARLAAPPPLTDPVAARWTAAKALADARLASLDLLIRALDAPDAATWKAWGASRRAADHLWAEFARR